MIVQLLQLFWELEQFYQYESFCTDISSYVGVAMAELQDITSFGLFICSDNMKYEIEKQ